MFLSPTLTLDLRVAQLGCFSTKAKENKITLTNKKP